MNISLFEEFPTEENLKKLDLIAFPIKLYVAAHSLNEFNAICRKIENKRVKEVIYWPVLSKREGYWISPFSSRKALQRILGELQGQEIPVMLDLELPTTQNAWLYFAAGLWFFRNKMLIRSFIERYQREIYLAEYYPQGAFKERMLRSLGLHYDAKKVKVIKMFYHSLHNFSEDFLRRELEKGFKKRGEIFLIGFGTTAQGIHETERILLPEQLRNDLEIVREIGIKEVVIFRLGGLNKKFVEILHRFAE